MFWAQNTLRRSSSTISLEWHNLSSRKRNQGKQEWQKPQNVTQQPGHGKTIAGCVICQNQNQHLCALHPPRRNTKVTRAKHKKYKFGPLNSESVPHKRKASLETPQRAEAAALCINPGEGTKPPALSFYRYLPPGESTDSVSPQSCQTRSWVQQPHKHGCRTGYERGPNLSPRPPEPA